VFSALGERIIAVNSCSGIMNFTFVFNLADFDAETILRLKNRIVGEIEEAIGR
jgi:hypothetical protein